MTEPTEEQIAEWYHEYTTLRPREAFDKIARKIYAAGQKEGKE